MSLLERSDHTWHEKDLRVLFGSQKNVQVQLSLSCNSSILSVSILVVARCHTFANDDNVKEVAVV